MEMEDYIKQFRKDSYLLNPLGNFGSGMIFTDLNDVRDIDRELIRLDESKKKHEATLKGLSDRFKTYQQQQVNAGNRRPKDWPLNLGEDHSRLKARVAVADEEIKFLQECRKKATPPEPEGFEPIRHRSQWGTGRLRNGILVEIGGFRVSAEKDGTLRIDDPRSKHDGMPAWQFRTQIFKPMSWEYSQRRKVAEEVAKKENRSTANLHIEWPEPGIWNKESDSIEYPGYSAEVLRMTKDKIN